MAGFYIHIPFCRKACRYCDFHFSVSLGYKEAMVNALMKEIVARKEEYNEFVFDTLYFGGGTPSVLSIDEIERMKECVFSSYNFGPDIEITLEANPDDLLSEYTMGLKKAAINRLSIGIQSFIDRDLELMRRSHDSEQAEASIYNALEAGISNLNIDLIYGIPGQSISDWESNLAKAFSFDVKHISAYHLTFETGTVFDHWRKNGKLIPVDEDHSLEQFALLLNSTKEKGFRHYEISNFCREGFLSRHNSHYWRQVPYIGIGPSAHSYIGKSRRWNISDNKKYISATGGEESYYESEELSERDLYNEYVLTSLRTSQGMDMKEVEERFGKEYLIHAEKTASGFLRGNELSQTQSFLTLTEKGLFMADYVMREFFLPDDRDY